MLARHSEVGNRIWFGLHGSWLTLEADSHLRLLERSMLRHLSEAEVGSIWPWCWCWRTFWSWDWIQPWDVDVDALLRLRLSSTQTEMLKLDVHFLKLRLNLTPNCDVTDALVEALKSTFWKHSLKGMLMMLSLIEKEKMRQTPLTQMLKLMQILSYLSWYWLRLYYILFYDALRST